jgi:hypothetical protein
MKKLDNCNGNTEFLAQTKLPDSKLTEDQAQRGD